MEKLFIVCMDKSRMTVDCKMNGTAKPYFDGLAINKSRIKSAYIQRYPKKDNPPVMLIEEGEIC